MLQDLLSGREKHIYMKQLRNSKMYADTAHELLIIESSHGRKCVREEL